MKKLFNCAMNIGEQMLICGAEVHRVEDSLDRILRAMGAQRVDVFIITSSMVVTVHMPNGEVFTQTRRIKETGTDFERLHELNELSRKICREKMSAEQIDTEMSQISASKKYPQWLISVCYSVIAGAFTLFFGGDEKAAGVSLFIGLVVSFVMLICDRMVNNRVFSKFMSSLVASFLAFAALSLGIIHSIDVVIIGNIMTLIPGLGLTNALHDLLVGDSIAGLLRTVEACITALAIAAGYFVLVFLTGGAAI